MGRKLCTSVEQEVKMFKLKEDGWTFKAIAEQANVSVGTVYNAVKRASSNLKLENGGEYTSSQLSYYNAYNKVRENTILAGASTPKTAQKVGIIDKIKTFFYSLVV